MERERDDELFNPAALEVKTGIGVNDLPALQTRLSEFVRESSMGCGLLVVDPPNLEKMLKGFRARRHRDS